MINEFIDFLNESPVAFGAAKTIEETLKENDYEEYRGQKVKKGKKYYFLKNKSSVIAFNIGKKLDDPSLHMVASHTDCPCFKLKPNPVHKSPKGIQLNVEPYGGMQLRTWIDRPLSLAGRVVVNNEDKIAERFFNDSEPFCIIPNVAPHLNRELDAKPLNIPADVTPIVSVDKDFDFNEYLGSKLNVKKEDILSFDLYLYPTDKAYIWGQNKEFVTGCHMDNLESAYVSLMGFINNFNDNNINLYAAFDNEEVGSMSRQGADSDILENLLNRICNDLNVDYYTLLNQTMMVSFDSAHAIHPNHMELYDADNAPEMNKGLAVKFNASQSYTSDSLSYAILAKLLNRNKIPFQTYSNKTGIRGGSTLGRLSVSHVSVLSIDVGIALWSMHSIAETGGTKDVETAIDAMSAFYGAHLHVDENDNYSI